MSAYIIVNVDVHDAERYEDYKQLAAPTVGAFGGKYIVRPLSLTPRPEGLQITRLQGSLPGAIT